MFFNDGRVAIEFSRVLPRDLFNEAKLLSMHMALFRKYFEGKLGDLRLSIDGSVLPFNDGYSTNLSLTDSGDLILNEVSLLHNGEPVLLEIGYNSGKEDRYPLLFTVPEQDLYVETVFTDEGELSDSFKTAFKTADSNEDHTLKDKGILYDHYLSMAERCDLLKKLGSVGLCHVDGYLPQSMEFDIDEPFAGFVFDRMQEEGGAILADTLTVSNLDATIGGEKISFFTKLDEQEEDRYQLYAEIAGDKIPVFSDPSSRQGNLTPLSDAFTAALRRYHQQARPAP